MRRNSATFRLYVRNCAAVVVEGATVTSMQHGATTMLALGLVLNTVGLGLFCWLIFALAVYAVPFFVAVSIGMLALNSGAGVIGALLVGIVAGALDARYRSNRFRNDTVDDLACSDRAVFAVPAAIAGYHVVLAMSQIGVPFPGLA